MLTQKTIKQINSLNQKKFRQQTGLFIVEGVKGVGEALKNKAEVELLIIEDEHKNQKDLADLARLAKKNKIPGEFCQASAIKKIKTTDTFPGVLALVKQPDIILDDVIKNTSMILCLDGVRDPGNLGAIIRTADWFGINSMILSSDCAEIYNPKTVRSTMGSIFRIKVWSSPELAASLSKLKKHGFKIFGLDLSGSDLAKIMPCDKTIFVLGSESHGLSPKVASLCDKMYNIKGKGQTESLNVAIAAGILLNKIAS